MASKDQPASSPAKPPTPPTTPTPQAKPTTAQSTATATTTATAPAPGSDLRLGRITVQNGNVNFSDFFVKPNYTANLVNVGGGVSELIPERAGDVLLRARIDNSGPVEVTGQINPLIKNLFLDMRADARDIDLPAMTPYLAKYVGYGIEKGKLSLTLQYKLENNALNAENNVFLDQLTFGERIESPTATTTQRLDTLVKALNERPALRLDVGGRVDSEADRNALRQAGMDRAVRQQMFNELARKGTPVATVDAAVPEPQDDLRYLEAAVRALGPTSGPAPKPAPSPRAAPAEVPAAAGATVAVKPTPPTREALEERLLETIVVSADDLRDLANRRAQNAKEYFVKAGIASERVFIVAAKLTAEALQDKGRLSRVDFGIK